MTILVQTNLKKILKILVETNEPKTITIKNDDLVKNFKEGDEVITGSRTADITNIRNDDICEIKLPHESNKDISF